MQGEFQINWHLLNVYVFEAVLVLTLNTVQLQYNKNVSDVQNKLHYPLLFKKMSQVQFA